MTTATTPTNECTATAPTLFCALETGASKWHLAFAVSATAGPRRRVMTARDVEQLTREIAQAKERFGLPVDAPVRSCYEAGREGFWLHRWLAAHGGDNLVVDSASIEVNRRARRVKTDRIDATKLVNQLIRHAAGEPDVWSAVQVPTVEQEDARQLHRELETVKRDRTRVLNRIQGLVAAHGLCWGTTGELPTWVAQARTWDGRSLPAGLCGRLDREWASLQAIEHRLAAIEEARATHLEQTADPVMALVRQLMLLRGVGINGAWLLVMEIFGWRDVRNRRQLAALAGLVGMPYDSGESSHEQGISKAGNRHVRWMMVQLAWAWLRYQPTSALSQWYAQRFAHGGKRLRRIGIVALARKLLIEFWRWLRTRALPAGAVTKPAGGVTAAGPVTHVSSL